MNELTLHYISCALAALAGLLLIVVVIAQVVQL